jgi:hypothetical protein
LPRINKNAVKAVQISQFMYGFQPPYDSPPETKPIALAPDGTWVISSDELPPLSIPGLCVVTNDRLHLDGWIFPFGLLNREVLVWLQKTMLRWTQEDPSQTNRVWLEGINEAFQNALEGPKGCQCSPAERNGWEIDP